MGFLTDLATHIKTWANGRFQTLLPTPAGNNGKVLSSDGTNYVLSTASSGGLTNFTEARNITAPNAIVPVHSIKATGTEANIDFAIVPKGTGSLVAQIPDGTAVGGNKRGQHAVDLQLSRTLSNQVASGIDSGVLSGSSNKATATNSVVSGGYTCSASGGYSVVAGGQSNTASGSYSVVSGGFGLAAYLDTQYAYPSFNPMFGKVYQCSNLVLQKYTTAGVTAEMFLDMNSNRAVLKNKCSWAFDIVIQGHSYSNPLHAARFKRSGLIVRGTTAATTTLEGDIQTIGTDIINTNLAGCAVAISADTTNGSLKVEVTAPAAVGMYWLARIELVEIEY